MLKLGVVNSVRAQNFKNIQNAFFVNSGTFKIVPKSFNYLAPLEKMYEIF